MPPADDLDRPANHQASIPHPQQGIAVSLYPPGQWPYLESYPDDAGNPNALHAQPSPRYPTQPWTHQHETQQLPGSQDVGPSRVSWSTSFDQPPVAQQSYQLQAASPPQFSNTTLEEPHDYSIPFSLAVPLHNPQSRQSSGPVLTADHGAVSNASEPAPQPAFARPTRPRKNTRGEGRRSTPEREGSKRAKSNKGIPVMAQLAGELRDDQAVDSGSAASSSLSHGEQRHIKRDVAEDQAFNGGDRGGILRARENDIYLPDGGLLLAEDSGKGALPAERGFPIQIGSKLFRLSGASIMSDAPSYFSKFFEDQLRQTENGAGAIRTLYIDRDTATFQDIARHLQGYHIQPRDGLHYVRLFADAQFYNLPRLIKQLFDSEICIEIGDQNFRVPRDIFSSPGDSPNFFSLGFGAFFNTPEIFPGLERRGLLRPPSITPPGVPSRSAHIFSELLHLLRGYPLHIRNAEHRAELLRDCRYFHLRGLEQKLIFHHVSYNIERQKSEIIIRLEDIKQSGVSFVGDASPSDRSPLGGWVNYARPFVDDTSHELVVEIDNESMKVDLKENRANVYGDVKARVTSLLQVVANKMNLPTHIPLGLYMSTGGVAAQPVSPGNTPLSEDRVKIFIGRDAHVILDGEEYISESAGGEGYGYRISPEAGEGTGSSWSNPDQGDTLMPNRALSTRPPTKKRKRRGSMDEFGEWVVRRGQWRLKVQPKPMPGQVDDGRMELVLVAVKIDAYSGERGRNSARGFLE